MQTLNAAPRDAYTAAQVLGLLRDNNSVTVDKGLELVDASLNVTGEVSEFLRGGTVSRNSYATLHGTGRVLVSTELDWGRQLVRPYMILAAADGSISTRWNLGAYFMSIPTRTTRENPPTYDVDLYDVLQRLNTKVGESYSVDIGQSYLQAAQDIITAQGYTSMVVDQTSAALTLPAARVWPIDDHTTWLNIVNDLLGAIGYLGVWSDWDGRPHLQKYVIPGDRASEFTYTAGEFESIIGDDLRYDEDYFDTPNKWIGYRSNDVAGAALAEGNGIYTKVNQSSGKTSIDGRGFTIPRPLPLEAADQASLIARVETAAAADMSISAKIRVSTSPNPAHWHFDRLLAYEPRLGPPLDVLGTQWTLPLDGSDQTHEWTVLT